VETARRRILASGLYGPVSVDRFDGHRLPYVDGLVNLLVASEPGNVPMYTKGYQGTSLAVRGPNVVYCTSDALVRLDRATGRQMWRVPIEYVRPHVPGMEAALVLSDDAVYLVDRTKLTAYSLDDGARMWTGESSLNDCKGPDLFLTGGLVWAN
jgi:outer membrane protein assembly factor BamB